MEEVERVALWYLHYLKLLHRWYLLPWLWVLQHQSLPEQPKLPTLPKQSTLKTCEDCGGSGICTGCNGEGFILKKMSEGSAERARLAAKNMATRYTAGLPKKWSYCSRCLSSRSCATCGGTGRIS